MTAPRSASAPACTRQFLVVVDEDASLEQLPAAAAQAHRIKGRLLVALAQRRIGFTTDAAVARFAARQLADTRRRREREIHRLLRGSPTDWEVVTLPFRDSRSVRRRKRHLTTAALRLARRRGAAPLPTPDPQAAAEDWPALAEVADKSAQATSSRP